MINPYYIAFRAMGTQFEAWLETGADGDELLAALPARVESIEAALSRFRPESELSQLNNHSGEWVPVSALLMANIVTAKHGARLTDGLYNPLVLPALRAAGYDRSFELLPAQPATTKVALAPVADWREIGVRPREGTVYLPRGSAIDLGGVAKGWTASVLADELAEYGPCLISAGGDMAARGEPQELPGWVVSVAEPDSEADVLDVVLRDSAVVTSGIDRRRWVSAGLSRHHIIDPRTGQPAETDVRSVTIIHPHAPTAEAYAKAVLIMGSQAGLKWLGERWDAAGLVVRGDDAVLATSNWQSYIYE